MVDGFQGETVMVSPVIFDACDSFGNPAREYGDSVEICDVLIAPASTSNAIEDGVPDGVAVIYTLYIPKGIAIEWRGAKVHVRGEEFRVIGDPKPWGLENIPGSYNLVVSVARHE